MRQFNKKPTNYEKKEFCINNSDSDFPDLQSLCRH
jgi:hypothetical protein